jgi:predicted glycogen debranching enzyme
MQPSPNSLPPSSSREWLEADGLGGFASGTSTGIRSRRYHALLLAAKAPPAGRMVLVNGFDAWVQTANGTFPLSSQIYSPGVVGGDGTQRIDTFSADPWPRWTYQLEDGTRIELELFVPKGQPMTCLAWSASGPCNDVTLHVRPFLSGRDYHSLHRANAACRFDATQERERIAWQTYPDVPGVTALTNGAYVHDPKWYYNFLYEEERARGLDFEEDLADPGIISWNLHSGPAVLILMTTDHAGACLPATVDALDLWKRLRKAEQRRRSGFASRLHLAADAYVVERANPADPNASQHKTIIAGYPWFTDWGRDTFIALRGVCLATGRLNDAREILLSWATSVSEGMLPNRFPDHGERPEYNSVDASLWFVIAVHEYLSTAKRHGWELRDDRRSLAAAVESILEGYTRGTRFGIRADEDGLLACGTPGVQLTWMDAKVGDWVVTPRIGKPVEVQALWLNALSIASQFDDRWLAPLHRGRESFHARYWNPERRMLYDVLDVNHERGVNDASFRPNQIFAVGGLPLRLVTGDRAAHIVDAVTRDLWTPLGLRSLAPGEPGYISRYEGGVHQRDGAYHQGTVWPWLLGAFVDAWLGTRQSTPSARAQARRDFLRPLLDHLDQAGLGHISEIADADAPHTPHGCPWQAWSVGEALWIDQILLARSPRQVSRHSETTPAQRPRRPALRPA